jgi:hypothetical protein
VSNFVKSLLEVAELFHANGGIDMTKLRVAFRNFVKAPEKKGGCGIIKQDP